VGIASAFCAEATKEHRRQMRGKVNFIFLCICRKSSAGGRVGKAQNGQIVTENGQMKFI
jgi:hypothetical protein